METTAPSKTTAEVHLGAPTTLRRHCSMPDINSCRLFGYTRIQRVKMIASDAKPVTTEEQRITVAELDQKLEPIPRNQKDEHGRWQGSLSGRCFAVDELTHILKS